MATIFSRVTQTNQKGRREPPIAERSLDFCPPWLQSVQTAGFFSRKSNQILYIHQKSTIMEIVSVNGKVLYVSEKESMKDAVVDAVKSGANLSGADLGGADLGGADLSGAYLGGADLGGANLSGAYLSVADLSGAYLGGADLGGADLSGAYLSSANLSGANLSGAYLSGANLSGANLSSADLSVADLSGADLGGANLSGADLSGADLSSANLSGAKLSGADLSSANLSGAINISYIPLRCPSEGSFIAWKKVDNKLVQLEIPADARRSSATSEKCRCDKAKVLSITDISTNKQLFEVINKNHTYTRYKVGEMVYPDAFDENRFNECSNGIHFFIDKQSAINY